MLVAHHVVGPRDQSDEVGGQRHGLGQLPLPRRDLLGPGVAHDHPVLRGAHVEGVRRLEVRLVEAGEDGGRSVEERHRVRVVPAVGRVDRAVQPLAVVAVAHHRLDHELVVTAQAGQREPPVGERGDVQRAAVEPGGAQLTGLDVDERVASAMGGEADGGRRVEAGLVTGQVERDVVGRDGDQVGAASRLVEGEGAHGGHPKRAPAGRARQRGRGTAARADASDRHA